MLVLILPRRGAEHMAAQRSRILRATLRCISDLGIERASVAEIRREAGLSAGALYLHFANKDEIIVEALRSASVRGTHLPKTWPEFIAAVASMADENGFDMASTARSQIQVFALAIRPGPMRELLAPLVADALDFVVRHLTDMQAAGHMRLRMSPLRTALAISALKDGLIWSGLALNRRFDEIEADIVATAQFLVWADN